MSLSEIIQQGESKTLELKEKLPANDSIAKTIIAFSNTSGGKLIIGINDQREVVGLGETDIFDVQDKISSIIFDRCYPNILPEIYTANMDGQLILIIEVFRGNLLPYYLKQEGKNNGTYIRIGATNRKAGFDNLLELERQKRNISFDEEIFYEQSYQALDIRPIAARFEAIGKKLDSEKIKNLKLVKEEQGKIYPTHALVVLLGQYEHVIIKCARFKGKTMDVFLDKKEYGGDLFSQLEAAEGFIKNHINLRGEIKGLQRTDTYEIPTDALREALVNAIIHRDYSNRGRDIKVGVYDDLVNIVSPGGFPSTLTAEDILEGRSEVRNKIIARVFKELNYIEQWGSGIKRIRSSCIAQGLKEPSIREKGDFVDVELYRLATESDGKRRISDGLATDYGRLEAEEKAILMFVESNPKITTKELKALLDIGDTKAKELFKSLTEKNKLKRKGSGRSTYYVRVE